MPQLSLSVPNDLQNTIPHFVALRLRACTYDVKTNLCKTYTWNSGKTVQPNFCGHSSVMVNMVDPKMKILAARSAKIDAKYLSGSTFSYFIL